MKAVTVLILGFLCLATPYAVPETIHFADGSSVSGVTEKKIESEDRVTIFHDGGVKSVTLSAVSEPDREKLETQRREEAVETLETWGDAAKNVFQGLTHDSSVEDSTKVPEPAAVIGILGGILLILISTVWMFCASFVESPVWGLCFFVTGGLSWLPFLFIHFKRAWAPTLLSFVGLGVSIGGLVMGS